MNKDITEETSEDNQTVKQLTKWKNPPSVEDLKKNYTAAIPAHTEQTTVVEGYLSALAGELGIKIPKGRSQIQPKLIRTQAEWRYSALEEPFLSTKDMFDVDPRTFEDGEGAEDNKVTMNYQWNTQMDKVAFINEYVRAAVDEGTAIVQAGWNFKEAMREVEVDIVATPQQAQAYLLRQVQLVQMSQEEAMAQLQSGEPLVIGTKMEKRKVTVKNHPTFRVCEYDKCVIDPTCEGDIDNAEFIIMPFETNQSELKADGKYENLHMLFTPDKEVISGDTTDDEFMSTRDAERTFEFDDGPRKKITAYEYYGYWDINDTGITEPIKAVWVNNVMVKLEELPYPDKKLPFVAVQYLPIRKSIYGEPDGALLKDSQDIMGATYRGMIDVMGRSANGQMGMQKGMLDVANQKKFDNGEHFFYNQGFDPKTSIHMTTFNEIPNSAMEIISVENARSESLTGVKSFGGGLNSQSLGANVGGGKMALDSASKRELGILRRMSQGLEKLGRKAIAMNAAWLEDEEVMRITNKEFRTIQRDDLSGEFDLRLGISTAESDDQKAQELAFMLQTNAASMDPELARMIQADIAKLRKMPELAQQILDFEPTPDPLQQQMAQLQLQLLEAQVYNEQAKGKENAVDVDLKKAKTANEMAKAGKTSSEKDNLDYDYLDKESGAAHGREMEKKDFDRISKLDEKAFDVMNKPKIGLGKA